MLQFERRPLAAAIALLFTSPTWVAAQTAPAVVAQSAPSALPTLPEVKAQATPEEPTFRTDSTRRGHALKLLCGTYRSSSTSSRKH